MATTGYSSNYPEEYYDGNTQGERTVQDAEVIARARDYNTHDEELKAIQTTIGVYPTGTAPTGTLMVRVAAVESSTTTIAHSSLLNISPDDHHDETHSYASHTGTVSSANLLLGADYGKTIGTSPMFASVTGWMDKIYSTTGDLNGDGLVEVNEILAGIAFNKELFDDVFLVGFDYPWEVPTPAVPPIPGTGAPGGGAAPPPADGGLDDGLGELPTDMWAGYGADAAGEYDWPVALLINLDTGGQYAVRRFTDSGIDQTGMVTIGAGTRAETDSPITAGTNYGLMYFRKPPRMAIADDNNLITGSLGMIRVDSDQILLTDAGDNIVDIDIIPPQTMPLVAGSGVLSTEGVGSAGFSYAMTTAVDHQMYSNVYGLAAGTYSIYVRCSCPALNAGGDSWSTTIKYKQVADNGDMTVLSTEDAVDITSNAAADVIQAHLLKDALDVDADRQLMVTFTLLDSSTNTNDLDLYGLYMQRIA